MLPFNGMICGLRFGADTHRMTLDTLTAHTAFMLSRLITHSVFVIGGRVLTVLPVVSPLPPTDGVSITPLDSLKLDQ